MLLLGDKLSPYKQDTVLRYLISTIVLVYAGIYLPIFPSIFNSDKIEFGLIFVTIVGQSVESLQFQVNQACYIKNKVYMKYISCDQAYFIYIMGAIFTFIIVKAVVVNFANCVYISMQPHPELNPRAYITLNRKCKKISLFCIFTSFFAWILYLVSIKFFYSHLSFTIHTYIATFVLLSFYSINILFDRDLGIVETIVQIDKLKWEKNDPVNVNWASEENYNYLISTPQQLMSNN